MIIAEILNQDSSFFKIESPDIKSKISSKDIISFTYVEEMQNYNTGSLSIYDPDHVYSTILTIGTRLIISFGYGEQNLLQFKKSTSKQVYGSNSRGNIKALVVNPSGNANNRGVVVFNCSFYGNEFLDERNFQVHKKMTKKALIYKLLTNLGCQLMEVNFTQDSELLDETKEIMQNESNYNLLVKLAKEWRAMFRVSYNSLGQMTGIFISPQNIENPSIAPLMCGAPGGTSIFLEYKEGIANVLDYNWKNHAGDSGSGDNTRIIQGADGRVSFLRYVTKDDKVTVYKLNSDRIMQRLRQVDNFEDRLKLEVDYLKRRDFKSVAWAFDPISLSSAPQGLGYGMNAKIIGNPLTSAPLRVLFGKGFPTWFTPEKEGTTLANMYAKKVSHVIDNTGYKCDLEILDAFTIFGGSLL